MIQSRGIGSSMSERFFSLIPEQPDYVPSAEAQSRALEMFRSFAPKASNVEIRIFEHIQFIDQGEFFERVACPACETELKSKRWGELMNKTYESQFTDRLITMPCCGFKTDLNSLRYESPAGFARFVLEADSTDLDWLPADRQSMLEEVLGCKLRQIWTMY
jgi:hypothetical protein